MHHKWVIPVAILLLLLTANAFRWDTEARKTGDTWVLLWKTDRWTGQSWRVKYTPVGKFEIPTNMPTVRPVELDNPILKDSAAIKLYAATKAYQNDLTTPGPLKFDFGDTPTRFDFTGTKVNPAKLNEQDRAVLKEYVQATIDAENALTKSSASQKATVWGIRHGLTASWVLAVFITSVWLVVAAWIVPYVKRRRKKPKEASHH